MDFRDLEKEDLFKAEGSQITVWSGCKDWRDAQPEELDLENGFFRREVSKREITQGTYRI